MLWASLATLFHVDVFIIVLVFFGGVSLQLLSLSWVMISHTEQPVDGTSNNHRSMACLVIASFCLTIIVLSTLAAVHSKAAGICLILISLAPFFRLLSYFGIVHVTISGFVLKVLLSCYAVLAVLCGIAGAVLNPGQAFYWSSFTWGSLGLLPLCAGIHFDFFGPEAVYGPCFYPIFILTEDGKALREASTQGSGIVVFLVMLAVWSLWCSVCVHPYPAVVLFVITCLFLLSYVLEKSRNHDGFSKLIGLDASLLESSCDYSIRCHAPSIPEELRKIVSMPPLDLSEIPSSSSRSLDTDEV